MNRPAIVDARLRRHRRQRHNLNFMASESFNVQTQQMLDRFQGQPGAAGAQGFMTAASFQGVVATARPRISAAKRKSGMGPRFELFNRNSAQGFGAGAQAGKGG